MTPREAYKAALEAAAQEIASNPTLPLQYPAIVAAIRALPIPDFPPDPLTLVCGACGDPWTGQKCGQADNGHPFPVCFPSQKEDGPGTPDPRPDALAQAAPTDLQAKARELRDSLQMTIRLDSRYEPHLPEEAEESILAALQSVREAAINEAIAVCAFYKREGEDNLAKEYACETADELASRIGDLLKDKPHA